MWQEVVEDVRIIRAVSVRQLRMESMMTFSHHLICAWWLQSLTETTIPPELSLVQGVSVTITFSANISQGLKCSSMSEVKIKDMHIILTSAFGCTCRAYYLLYPKVSVLGKKITYVWEEKESLVNSIWWCLVPLRCWQKMAQWLGHPVTLSATNDSL